MPKETLQHTMRSKVRVFEDGGIRLLRKGQKGQSMARPAFSSCK